MKDIQADTVQAEFKTDKNKLSVWKVESEEDLLDALIALGSNCDYIGAIDAVKIYEQHVQNFRFEEEEGDTPTIGINEKHRNITDLNYVSLGELIKSMICGIQCGYVRKNRREMTNILVDAYINSKLDIEKLKPSMFSELERALAKRGINL